MAYGRRKSHITQLHPVNNGKLDAVTLADLCARAADRVRADPMSRVDVSWERVVPGRFEVTREQVEDQFGLVGFVTRTAIKPGRWEVRYHRLTKEIRLDPVPGDE
jgi:hypothetical protein